MPSVRSGSRVRRPVPVSGTLQQLGHRIRRARVDAGLSQAQLGTPHFTRAYVSAIELGKVRPAMKSLEFLADKLGKPVSFFVADEEADRRRDERILQLARANQLVAEGRAREAIGLIEPLLASATTSSERADLQRGLGRALREAGINGPAVAALSDAIQIFKVLGDREQLARAHGELGACLVQLMSFGEAEAELEQALVAISKGDLVDPVAKVHVLYNLGLCAYGRGDFRTALDHFQRAEQEGSDIGDPKWLGSLFAAIGMSRQETGDFESAVMYLRRSETLFESINNRVRASEIKFQTAIALRALGHKTKSNETYAAALAGARASGHVPLAIRIGTALALAMAEDGDYDDAVARAEGVVMDADATGESTLRVVARFALGRALRKVDSGRAEQVLRDGAAIIEHLPSNRMFAELYVELSEVLAENGLSDDALNYSRRAYLATRQR
ncbi:MAG TPA: tetratricopeptide repeat protein [Candidatus Limnocylindria bacterium]